MATAEYVTKVHAVCTHTGNLAHYSFRKAQNDKVVLLGEMQEYEPLSRAAYYKAIEKQKKEIRAAKTKKNPKDTESN
jgi:thymidine kinase